MKTLKEYVNEAVDTAKYDKKEVEAHIKRYFKGAKAKISRNPNSDGLYEVKLSGSNITYIGTYRHRDFSSWEARAGQVSITGNKFVITDIDCKTLFMWKGEGEYQDYDLFGIKGLPDKLNCHLIIQITDLENLEDLPKEVDSLTIVGNQRIKDLTGLNNCKIKDSLCIKDNEIRSIAGLPDKVNGNFTLQDEVRLNLAGQENHLPKHVGKNCTIRNNGKYAMGKKGKQYSAKMIAKFIDVKGEITADR